MTNLQITELTTDDIRAAVRRELESFFAEQTQTVGAKENQDEIGGISLAMEITGLAKPTIYSLCSERKIPHSKKSKFLYFSRKELTDWLTQGKRRTQAEIAIEAETFGEKGKEAIQPTKHKHAS